MNAPRNSAGSVLAALSRMAHAPTLALLLSVCLTGCHHKAVPQTIPLGAQAPVALEEPAAGAPAPTIAAEPLPDLGPLQPVKPSAPVQRRRSSPKEEPPPPSPSVAAPAPAALAIGSLSTGADVTPQIQQQAQDMISSMIKSVATLPARVADAQKRQIRQVRHFLEQAQQALNTGDTEGSKNLATKARLLLDDLEKK